MAWRYFHAQETAREEELFEDMGESQNRLRESDPDPGKSCHPNLVPRKRTLRIQR
jgi:hypothetical protein